MTPLLQRFVAAALALAGVGAGCTAGADHQSARTVTAGLDAALTRVVHPSHTRGGTLTLVAGNAPDSLDGGVTYYGWVWNYLRLWQRTLMAVAPAPGRAGLRVVPDLAATAGQPSSDGRTWTYRLRPGLRFETGAAITSADIKYAIERVFAQDVITGGPSSYYLDLLDNGQHYPGPYRDHSIDGLRSIQTPDPLTIVFHLRRPFAEFDNLMSLAVTTPVPATVDQTPRGGVNYAKHPVATGPYRLTTSPHNTLVLARNPQWDPRTDPIRWALPDRIVLRYALTDQQLNQLQLKTGALRIDSAGLTRPDPRRLQRDPATRDHVDAVPFGAVRFLSLQQQVPPLNNVHCRRAVQYAVDKRSAVLADTGAGGTVTVTSTMAGTLTPGYDPTYNPYPDGPDWTGNLAAARHELRLCGRPRGFRTVLAAPNTPNGPPTATAVARALARVGIDATPALSDVYAYFQQLPNPRFIRHLHIGIAFANWGPDFPSGYGYWHLLVDGRAHGGNNWTQLNDPVINAELDAATRSSNPADVVRHYRDVAHRVMTVAVLVPLANLINVLYRSPQLTNIYVQPFLGTYDLTRIGVRP